MFIYSHHASTEIVLYYNFGMDNTTGIQKYSIHFVTNKKIKYFLLSDFFPFWFFFFLSYLR